MSFDRLSEMSCGQCDSLSSYDASVDFSNACRSLYFNKVKRTEEYRDKVVKCSEGRTEKQRKSSMEMAMQRLGKEMALLMEQDLSLVRQLLTMNETIEDIKNNRMYGSISKGDLHASSNDVID